MDARYLRASRFLPLRVNIDGGVVEYWNNFIIFEKLYPTITETGQPVRLLGQ